MTASKEKIAITIDAEALREVRARVERGEVASVSAFVNRAVQHQLSADEQFREMVAADLAATGGPLSAEERRWVDEAMGEPSS